MSFFKNKRKFISILLILINLYIIVATYLPYSYVVGGIGTIIGSYNRAFLGALSFVIPLIVLYYLINIYLGKVKSTIRTIEHFLAFIIFFMSLLIFQAVVFDKGVFGIGINTILKPYIGTIGIWIFFLFLFITSLCNILNLSLSQLYYFALDFNKKNFMIVVEYVSNMLVYRYKDIKDTLGNSKKDIKELQDYSTPESNNLDTKEDSEIHRVKIDEDNLNNKLNSDNIEKMSEDKEYYQEMINDLKNEVDDIKSLILSEREALKEEIKKYGNESKEKIENEIDSNTIAKITNIYTPQKRDNRENINHVAENSDPVDSIDINLNVTTPSIEPISLDPKENSNEINSTDIKDDEVVEEISSEIDNKQNKTHRSVEILKEVSANKKLLEDIELDSNISKKVDKDFILPSVEFFNEYNTVKREIDEDAIDLQIEELISKLKHFKIRGDIVRTYTGPVVTTFEFKPYADVKISKILNLSDDLAMALRAQTIRIQAPIPGKDVVGIEIPNKNIETIYIRELFENDLFKNAKSPLTLVLGKDIVGNPFVTDLGKLPHLLIAGTTGSGKSVGINAMILSLLYKNRPKDLRFVMIDPKMLEFSMYNDIPHLLTPVITQPKEAIIALNNLVLEMERRYKLLSDLRVKNIDNYNEKIEKDSSLGEKLPYIVVVIDELADLMMTGGKDAELPIARLAQMARASGIHLIVATQRPSVDVVTGLIKTNLSSRISFKVGQKIDSKVILDTLGAETLLGRGDMLFTPPGSSSLVRLHAPWVTEKEIDKIVNYLKQQQPVVYDENFLNSSDDYDRGDIEKSGDLDELFDEARDIVLTERKTSISYLQRRLQIGYNRSARIIEQLESEGVISSPNNKNIREII